MFSQRFTARNVSERRHARRRTVMRRRGWFVQRLEPRCVMAADWFDANPLPEPTLEHAPLESTAPLMGAPDGASDLQPADSMREWDNALDEVGANELHVSIDWSSAEPIRFEVGPSDNVVLHWDAQQLEQLFGAHEQIQLSLIYDANLWQVPPQSAPDTSAASGAAIDASILASVTVEQHLPRLNLVSLERQAAQLHVEIPPASVELGPPTKINLTLIPSERSDDSWYRNMADVDFADQFDSLLANWGSGNAESVGNVAMPAVKSDSMPCIDAGDGSEFGGVSTETSNDDLAVVHPLDDAQSTPLPEPTRSSGDRGARLSRRTLDIRTPNPVNSNVSSATRSAISADSLVSQAALTRVYADEALPQLDAARWMINPQPARIQAATFLLSRTRSETLTTKTTASAASEANSRTEAQANSSPASSVTALDEPSPETPKHVATRPAEAEVTQAKPPASIRFETEDASRQQPQAAPANPSLIVYAMERMLESPFGLVTILGLTLVARMIEPDESSGQT